MSTYRMCTYISSFSAKGVKMEWIKTKDKLPKIGEKVFYYFEYVGVHFGRFTGFYTDEETGEYYPDMHVFTDMEGGWLTGDVGVAGVPPKAKAHVFGTAFSNGGGSR